MQLFIKYVLFISKVRYVNIKKVCINKVNYVSMTHF
jgi:hypothetical protein